MVIERLRAGLAPAHRGDAQKVWDYLVASAGELGPVGGGATRATLADQLTKAGFNIGSAPSSRNDIRALQQESLRALAEIRSNIQGLKLHRATAHEGVRAALSEARFVQVDGEPGTGKSAVLKGIAEESARNGPVLVLKDSRIHAKGWSAHAHVLGVSADISELLREFGCAVEPILFIDGIDKISELSVQLTVNDVLTAIASDETLAAWRVLVTVRGRRDLPAPVSGKSSHRGLQYPCREGSTEQPSSAPREVQSHARKHRDRERDGRSQTRSPSCAGRREVPHR
jgi:hypothetical protein